MIEKVLYVNSNNILGIESIVFLSAFILTFLFVAESVPAFFAILITAHELSHQIKRGVLNNRFSLSLKGSSNHGSSLNLWSKWPFAFPQ